MKQNWKENTGFLLGILYDKLFYLLAAIKYFVEKEL